MPARRRRGTRVAVRAVAASAFVVASTWTSAAVAAEAGTAASAAVPNVAAEAAIAATAAAPGVAADAAPNAATDAGVDAPGAVAARAVLAAQRDAWNRGDLDAFMRGYWRGDDLRFAGGDAIEVGWQTTLDRYRRTYPDAAAMGRLDFELVEVRDLAPDAVYVFGRWRLARAADAPDAVPHGLFTLIVERKGGEWVITRDHTSSAERKR